MEPIERIRGPLIVVNFKAYMESTGKRAMELAKIAEKVANEIGATIVVAPQFSDLKSVSEQVDIPVFSQHLDPVKPGAFTGRILAEAVKSAGAEGSILNHSERRIGPAEISECIQRCVETDLQSLACADTVQSSQEVARLRPNFVAIEPPDLIGSGISVSRSRPELITEGVRGIRVVNKTVRILCGAGITTSDDVSKALELGTEGVLVASSVVKSKTPEQVLSGMGEAMMKTVKN